jgi:hypothetical protein
MNSGRTGGMTPIINVMTTLFVALNVPGECGIGCNMQRHRDQEFI